MTSQNIDIIDNNFDLSIILNVRENVAENVTRLKHGGTKRDNVFHPHCSEVTKIIP